MAVQPRWRNDCVAHLRHEAIASTSSSDQFCGSRAPRPPLRRRDGKCRGRRERVAQGRDGSPGPDRSYQPPGSSGASGTAVTAGGSHYGLGWYSADLDQPRQAVPTRIRRTARASVHGRLRVLARVFRRTSVSAKAARRILVQRFKLRPDLRRRLPANLEAHGVATDVSNTFVLKPEVSAWTDITRKIGVNVSVGYIVAQAGRDGASSLGNDRRRIHADVVHAEGRRGLLQCSEGGSHAEFQRSR